VKKLGKMGSFLQKVGTKMGCFGQKLGGFGHFLVCFEQKFFTGCWIPDTGCRIEHEKR